MIRSCLKYSIGIGKTRKQRKHTNKESDKNHRNLKQMNDELNVFEMQVYKTHEQNILQLTKNLEEFYRIVYYYEKRVV
jgi:septal ring factor EnvC (AmiA/AmiB activator)